MRRIPFGISKWMPLYTKWLCQTLYYQWEYKHLGSYARMDKKRPSETAKKNAVLEMSLLMLKNIGMRENFLDFLQHFIHVMVLLLHFFFHAVAGFVLFSRFSCVASILNHFGIVNRVWLCLVSTISLSTTAQIVASPSHLCKYFTHLVCLTVFPFALHAFSFECNWFSSNETAFCTFLQKSSQLCVIVGMHWLRKNASTYSIVFDRIAEQRTHTHTHFRGEMLCTNFANGFFFRHSYYHFIVDGKKRNAVKNAFKRNYYARLNDTRLYV